MLLNYAILLYDFGWTMLAVKSFNKLLLNDYQNYNNNKSTKKEEK